MKLFKNIETTFDNFDESIKSFLSKAFNNLGLQYTNTQIFGIIFNGIKGVMQNIMFYIEDAFTEQNVYTATRRNSIFSLAKVSGFEPSYGTSAGGVLLAKMHLNNLINKNHNIIYINNHSTIVNKLTGEKYSIILPTNYYILNINNPLIEYQFKIQQGTFVKNNYVAKGNELETIHISSVLLFDRNYVTITVDGEIYEEVACLYDMGEDGKNYVLNIGFDNSFDIIFGNGTYGQKLKDGQVVTIEYLSHNGLLGNIKTNELYELEFEDSGTDILGNNVNINDYLDLSISTFISGGNNADDIDFIKNMIGFNSRSLIYSSADSMKLFLKRFSFIGYNNCYTSLKNNKIHIIALQNIVNLYDNKEVYYNLTDKDLLLTEDQKNMIISTLSNSNKTIAGFNIDFIDPIIRRYSIVLYVKIKSEYQKEIVKYNINNIVLDYFLNLPYSVKFIAKSDIVNLILNNDTDNLIESIDLTFISEYNENSYFNKEYEEYLTDTDFYEDNITINRYNINNTPGLDIFGNISLNTIAEIPKLSGNFKYYTDKENYGEESIITKPIEIYFI